MNQHLVKLDERRKLAQNILDNSPKEFVSEAINEANNILESKGIHLKKNYQPKQGIDYDDLIEVYTYADLDDAMLKLRGSIEPVKDKDTFNEIFNLKTLDVFPDNIIDALDDKKQFIGWLFEINGKKTWVRMSMNSMKQEHYKKNGQH